MENFEIRDLKSPLFDGVSADELNSMIHCLNPQRRNFAKGERIYDYGQVDADIGLVRSGQVHVVKEDFWGNCSILAEAGPGEVFGEAYAAAPGVPVEVAVDAVKPSEIIFLGMQPLLTTCSNACPFHNRMISNLLGIMARRNLQLTRKLECMAQRTTRDKLLTYLSGEAKRRQSAKFTIPFNRQQLADYLSVDRSAMSTELGRLRDEGVLRFHKNEFELLK